MIPMPLGAKALIGTTRLACRFSLKLAMALLLVLQGARASCATRPESRAWWEQADLIAAVEVLNVDDSATASDGPMYAEARILKVLRGPSSSTTRFGASAWLGPTYRKGDRRILFLQRTAPAHAYFRNVAWSSLETGKLDLFITGEALQSLTYDSLVIFLKRLSQTENKRLRADVTVLRSKAATLELQVRIANAGNETLYLDPAKLTVGIDAGSVHRYLAIQWDGATSGWLRMEPGASLRGTGKLGLRELEAVASANLILENHSVCYPYPSWTGASLVSVVFPQAK
jgi:hypothetical protein